MFSVNNKPLAEVAAFLVAGLLEEGDGGLVRGCNVGVQAMETKGVWGDVGELVEHCKGISLSTVLFRYHDANGSPQVQWVIVVQVHTPIRHRI